MWLFDVDPVRLGRPPARPTFGLNLVGGRGFGGRPEPARWRSRPGRCASPQIFATAQEAWDERFVTHSTRVRTIAVDAADVGTTDFHLPEAKQRLLLANGRAAAASFLDRFELDDYLNTFHARLAPARRAPSPAAGG